MLKTIVAAFAAVIAFATLSITHDYKAGDMRGRLNEKDRVQTLKMLRYSMGASRRR